MSESKCQEVLDFLSRLNEQDEMQAMYELETACTEGKQQDTDVIIQQVLDRWDHG